MSSSRTVHDIQTTSDPEKTLPPGCSRGPPLYLEGKRINSSPKAGETPNPIQAIWVDFPHQSPDNPYFFSPKRKFIIMSIALFFANITALQTSSYSIGFESMQRDLGMTDLQAATGVSLYGWGFAIGPLVLAPMTEEFGRFWFYIGSISSYMLFHLTGSLAPNVGTVLAGRFLLGISGCIGATVVAGTVADIYPPDQRGPPMSIFTLLVTTGPGLGPVIFCWVEATSWLEWRWIYWIQMIALGIYLPFVYFFLPETRAPVLLRRRAKALRTERGVADGGRYTARGDVDKPPLIQSLKKSLSRPLLFLALEPIVTFFAVWAALVWGVFFIEIAGLPYVFKTVHGFTVTQSGLTYIAVVLGTVIGFFFGYLQDNIYHRRVAKDGVEARLYAPMVAGIAFALGCIIFGLTSVPGITWVAPCIGIIVIMAAAFTIYNCCFVYLAECYGSHASSAVAGMSFLRIFLGSSFPMFTRTMFDTLTPRWSLFMIGCIALPLAGVPFLAYFKGKWIRDRSPYSKRLMAEELHRLEIERGVRPAVLDSEGTITSKV